MDDRKVWCTLRTDETPFLMIKVEGQSIGEERIPISHLVHLLEHFQKVLLRTGQVLMGESESTRKGRKSSKLREELDLELVLLTHGSPTTVLGFERRG